MDGWLYKAGGVCDVVVGEGIFLFLGLQEVFSYVFNGPVHLCSSFYIVYWTLCVCVCVLLRKGTKQWCVMTEKA